MYMKALPQLGEEISSTGDQNSNTAGFGLERERLLYIRTPWLGDTRNPHYRFVKKKYIVFHDSVRGGIMLSLESLLAVEFFCIRACKILDFGK